MNILFIEVYFYVEKKTLIGNIRDIRKLFHPQNMYYNMSLLISFKKTCDYIKHILVFFNILGRKINK
jgi:hypothetical protein